MLQLSIILAEQTQQQLLQQGQQQLKNQKYQDAIQTFSQILQQNSSQYTAQYFRGMAYIGTKETQKALNDFKKVIDNTAQTKTVNQRSKDKIFEICQEHCELQCTIKLSNKYFNGQRQFNELQQIQRNREIILQGGADLDGLIRFSGHCVKDSELLKYQINQALSQGNLTVMNKFLQNYIQSQITPSDKLQFLGKVIDGLILIQDNKINEFIKKYGKLNQQYNDFKVSQQYVKYVRTINQGTELLESLHSIQDVQTNKKEIEQIDEKLNKISNQDLTQQICQLLIDCQLLENKNVYNKVEQIIIQLLDNKKKMLHCAADKLTKNTDEECINVTFPSTSLFTPLLILFDLKKEVPQLQQLQGKPELIQKLEYCDQQISQAYTALQHIAQDSDQDKKKLTQLLDEIIKLDNKVFNMQQIALQPNFYKVLNVSRNAQIPEIRKKYFKLARKYHPDQLPQNATKEMKQEYSTQFQLVAEAYEVLSDPDKRKEYDQGRYNQEARAQKEANHQQRQERTRQIINGGGQQGFSQGIPFFQQGNFQGGQQQFFFGGDPFQFFQNMGFDFFGGGFGNQQQQQQQQQGNNQQQGQRRVKININGQEFFM